MTSTTTRSARLQTLTALSIRQTQASVFGTFNQRRRWLDRKYHAGASSVIDTDKIRLSKSAPPGVKTNILPMVTPLGRKRLYFLPDRVLLLDAVGFGAISYQDLRVELE